MKQENKFVAQLFHYLAPFADVEKDLYICIDGGAARTHSGFDGAPLLDPDVPDIWMTFVGQPVPTGIEAKIVENGSISFRRGQITAWRSDGAGNYKPQFWVATTRLLDHYYCWRQESLVSRLDSTSSSVDNVVLSVSDYPEDFCTHSLPALAMYIIGQHTV